MFRTKICGITGTRDAVGAARAGADAIGLNFYRPSPRFVEPQRAAEIVGALPPDVVKVGLFVNASPREICDSFDRLRLDLVQLHGDEPPELLAELGGRPVMRAFRVGPDGLRPVETYLAECRRRECTPRMVLVDARLKGIFGGTGQVADWEALASYPTDGSMPPLVLAGGLTPDNVAEAVRTVRPAAVDTASGVESAPGRKDPALVRQFVAAALAAFESTGGLP